MSIDCTLTTACFDLTRFNTHSRTLIETINNIKPLLSVPCNLVVYTDNNCVDLIKNIRNDYNCNNITYYVVVDFEELEFFKYNEIIKQNRKIYHPTKDDRTCSESHILCCSKFNFVLQTIEINPFKTNKFGWIDANLNNNFSKICKNYTNNMLLYILNNINEKFRIQILNVCDKKYKELIYKKEYYESYKWVVCGCLFTTGKEIGVKVLNRLNKIFEETTILGYGHAEEMLYLEILDEFYNDIERSYGDYSTILNNFITPTIGYDYINEFIVKKYLHYGYNKECYDCCKKLLNEIENYKVEINYSVYFSILFSLFVSSFYYKNHETKEILKHINNLIDTNPYIKVEFDKNQDFYKGQFSYVQ
jgi:hypothetical protein